MIFYSKGVYKISVHTRRERLCPLLRSLTSLIRCAQTKYNTYIRFNLSERERKIRWVQNATQKRENNARKRKKTVGFESLHAPKSYSSDMKYDERKRGNYVKKSM